MEFKDNFSQVAAGYITYRPLYPPELFAYLASLVPEHEVVWDCGTGNGQAAFGLAPYFDRVIATDPSQEQLAQAIRHPKISYRVAQAEASGIEANSVDLLTVAQALHWFQFEVFYAEARRVLKENGVIAAWAYGLPHIAPAVDAVITHFHDVVVDEFWQAENRLIVNGYQSIPFPFEPIHPPAFQMEAEWNFAHLIGLLGTWSAVQRFKNKNGRDPVELIEADLTRAWGNLEEAKSVTWPLILKVGHK